MVLHEYLYHGLTTNYRTWQKYCYCTKPINQFENYWLKVISTDCIPCIFHLYFQRQKKFVCCWQNILQKTFKMSDLWWKKFKALFILGPNCSKPNRFSIFKTYGTKSFYNRIHFRIYHTRYMIFNFLHMNIIKLSFNGNWYEVDKSKLKTFYIWLRFTVSIKLLWEYQIPLVHYILYNTASSLHALS